VTTDQGWRHAIEGLTLGSRGQRARESREQHAWEQRAVRVATLFSSLSLLSTYVPCFFLSTHARSCRFPAVVRTLFFFPTCPEHLNRPR
jgi:hypothetical protein